MSTNPSTSHNPNVSDTTSTTDLENINTFLGQISENGSTFSFEPPSAPPRKSQNVPEEASRIYGEAAVIYARGSREEAKLLCLEVVKLAPSYAPAYQLLASICEDEENMEGYLQYQLVAAHLTPDDYDLWIHLADLTIQKGKEHPLSSETREKNFQLAAFCLRKATRVVPPSYPKLSIYERYLLTLENKPVKQYQVLQQILGDCLPQMFHTEYMDAFRSYASHSSLSGDHASAVNALTSAAFYCPEHFTEGDISLLIETAFTAKMWKHLVISFCRLNLVELFDSEHSTVPVNLRSSASIDNGDVESLIKWLGMEKCLVKMNCKRNSTFLFSRFIAALLHCNCSIKVAFQITDEMSKMIFPSPSNSAMEDYLTVARSAASATNLYHSLICKLIEPLLGTELLSMDAYNRNIQTAIEVNLWYANAKTAAGALDEAATYYKRILEASPQHIHVRQALADVFSKLDNREAAISVLIEKFPLDSLTVDEFALRLAQCSVLSQCSGCEDAFIEASTHLLFGDKCSAVDDKTLTVFATVHTAKLFCSVSGSQTDDLELLCPALHTATLLMPIYRLNIPPQWFPRIWEVFELLCQLHFNRMAYMKLFRLLIFCFFAPPMHDFAIDNVRHILLVVSFAMRKWEIINTCVRSMIRSGTLKGVMQFPNAVWNMLAMSSTHLDDMRAVTRSITRILGKKQSLECDAIHYMLGHAAFVRGNYRVALREYGSLIKRRKKDPLPYLMAGMCFVQLSANKFRNGRPLLVYQALCCFERYREYRGECQEVFLNIGRALHHVGFTYLAAEYYKRCLGIGPCCEDDNGRYDLRPEAAFNLSLICRRSGSLDAARYYLSTYCIIA